MWVGGSGCKDVWTRVLGMEVRFVVSGEESLIVVLRVCGWERGCGAGIGWEGVVGRVCVVGILEDLGIGGWAWVVWLNWGGAGAVGYLLGAEWADREG
eukprot:gene10272-21436_t